MKPSIVVALLALASFGASTAAWAYTLSPPNTFAKLKGTLKISPFDGGQSFMCRVIFEIKTQKPQFKKQYSKIIAASLPAGDCADVSFQGLPWQVTIENANSGEFGMVIVTSDNGECRENTQFQDNGSGVWTMGPGQCLSGTLKSAPPITIVP